MFIFEKIIIVQNQNLMRFETNHLKVYFLSQTC